MFLSLYRLYRRLSGQIVIFLMTVIKTGIGKEKSLIKIKSDEFYDDIVCFDLRFCQIVQRFAFFEASILEHLYVILSNGCFVSALNLIGIFNVDFVCFVMKEVMKKHFCSVCLRTTKDIIRCHKFYCNFYERNKSEFSMLEMPIFSDLTFLIEPERIVDWRIRACDTAFLWNHVIEFEFSRRCEYDKIETEFDVFREVLKLSGGSGRENVSTSYRKKSHRCLDIDDSVEIITRRAVYGNESFTAINFSSKNNLSEIHGFENFMSLRRVEIPSSVEVIGAFGFFGCTLLNDIIFSSHGHLREINGFDECTSLCRIEIPSSVVIIGKDGFSGCASLNEVLFSSDSHLRAIDGFRRCTSLCRIEIPSLVEKIGDSGFSECWRLNEIVFSSDSHLREISGFMNCMSLCQIAIPSSLEVLGGWSFFSCPWFRIVKIQAGCQMKQNQRLRDLHPFVVHEGDDVKKCRRQIHLGIAVRRIL
jgi:hypothetical protein